MEKCELCEEKKTIIQENHKYSIPYDGILMISTDSKEYIVEIKYCPLCGRKLNF